MDGQPFYCLANSIFTISPANLLILLIMDMIPRALFAIQRDWIRLRLRQTPVHQLTLTGVRNLLARLMSLKLRLIRCRQVRSPRAQSLRGSLLRAVFSGWRATLRKLVHIPRLRHLAVDHFQALASSTSVFDPNNWTIRLLSMDPHLFLGLIPAIGEMAPETARAYPQGPFWRALKLNLSTARL